MNSAVHRLPDIPMQGVRAYPPRLSEFTQTFWNALREGRWQTTYFEASGKCTFPPKGICPHSWSDQYEWRDMCTTGTLYSWTRIHAAPMVFQGEAPYAVGIVDLDDGLRLACRLQDMEGIALAVNMRVEMVVLQYEDGALPAARPVVVRTENA